MALFTLEDFDKNFHKNTGGNDIKNYDVYSDVGDDKVGSVQDILVDETGNLRYLVVNTGMWSVGKRVLLPVGRSRIDDNNRRVYARGLTKDQVERLPDFNDLERVNYDYEEQVREVYRTPIAIEAPLETEIPFETEIPLEASAPLEFPRIDDEVLRRSTHVEGRQIPAYAEPKEQPIPEPIAVQPIPKPVAQPVYNRETYTYQQDADLYQMNERDHQTLRLYEEQLIANKNRVKTGEVSIGKHVETETAQVAIPVERERVIIERTTPQDAVQAVSSDKVDFADRAVTHIDIYEEIPDIQKQAVVREEVKVRKVVEQDTIEAQETIRREELDVNTGDKPIQERKIS